MRNWMLRNMPLTYTGWSRLHWSWRAWWWDGVDVAATWLSDELALIAIRSKARRNSALDWCDLWARERAKILKARGE